MPETGSDVSNISWSVHPLLCSKRFLTVTFVTPFTKGYVDVSGNSFCKMPPFPNTWSVSCNFPSSYNVMIHNAVCCLETLPSLNSMFGVTLV